MAPAFMQPTAVSSLTEPVTIRNGVAGAKLPSQGERGHAIETGQGVVGEDQVGLKFVELPEEFVAGIDTAGVEWNIGTAELVFDELGVHWHIFENENSQPLRRHGGLLLRIPPTAPVPGVPPDGRLETGDLPHKLWIGRDLWL